MPQRYRILIADDSAQDRQAVILALQQTAADIDGLEADVLELDSIAQAREALLREEFACVFLDHDLPDGTSLDLLTALRSQGLATPVVVLTGERDEQAVQEVMRAGAVDYLPKSRLHPDLVARSLRAALWFLQAQREKQAILTDLHARDHAIAAASNGIVIADARLPDCPLIYTNAAFLRMTGYAEQEVIGRNCRFLQGAGTDPAAVQELHEAVQQEHGCQTLILNYRKDGTSFWNEITVSPVRDAHSALTHFIGVQTDVTARQEASGQQSRAQDALRASEEALRENGARLRDAQVRLEAALSAGGIATWTFDLKADRVVADANFARLFSVSPEEAAGGRLDVYLQSIHPDDRTRVEEGIADAIACREVYEAEYRVVLPDGSHRWLATRGKVERNAAGEAVALPGVVLDITEQVERGQQERFLTDLAERARGMSAPADVIADAVRSVGEFLGVSRCIFADIDIEADTCTILPDYRADSSSASIEGVVPISAFGPYVVAEYAARRAVVVDDVRLDPIKVPPESVAAYEAIGIRAHVTVPVVHFDRVVSCMSVHNSTPRHWKPEEIDLLRAVVERTWLTVEVLRQQRVLLRRIEEQRALAEREALLNRISLALRASPDPEQVLETAVRELGQAMGADRCYYAAYDQEADMAMVSFEWHRDGLPAIAGRYLMSSFAINHDPSYKAGRTQALRDTSQDDALLKLGLRAVVRVPLVSGASMTALSVAMTDGPRDWTPDEVSLVEAVATQTQTALEAVQVQRREHRIAEQLQAALQPELPQGVAGLALAKYYEAALEEAGVGGDFYDVFAIEKGHTALVVGDLSGKGLAAAAQVATVRNMLRAFLYSRPTVAEAITELNRTLAENNLLTGFTTLFAGAYDSGTRVLSYVNCGQEPALVRRAGTNTVEQLLPTGPVLGSIENAHYTEEAFTLAPGDALAVFSDGMTEVGPRRTEMLGIEGVAALFGAFDEDNKAQEGRNAAGMAEQLVLRLIAGVDAAAQGGVMRDDICLLVAVVE